MEERARRIVDAAIELAEKGGFEAVRLRDVAAHAGVALGTVYKRFESKEDILVAAIAREAEAMERLLETTTVRGETRQDRAFELFRILTKVLLDKPNFARAVLRSLATGETAAAERILAYQARVARMISAAISGLKISEAPKEDDPVAFLLQQVWFANLVGWMGGLHTGEEVVEQMRFSLGLILRDPTDAV
ncbi:MAG: AcrR family transcriptional regulator [Myxococcota bacterium]|jgi:AcrR family transcriptional regulator